MQNNPENPFILLQAQQVEDIFFKSSIPLSCKRLLNEDVEDFIVNEVENSGMKNNIVVSIKVSQPPALNIDKIGAIIHKHFSYCQQKSEQQLRTILKLGTKSLGIGIVFLVGMYLLTKLLESLLPQGGVMLTLREFFIIIGWVAMWRPADLLLYEWRPFKRKARLFERLAHCKIQLANEEHSR